MTVSLIPSSGAPPPTRGWTLRHNVEGEALEGSPAHAGMDPRKRLPGASPNGLPRPRGDGPQCAPAWVASAVAPPPTRGWTRLDLVGLMPDVGSPAHAGMDPRNGRYRRRRRRLPRPRGDGPRMRSKPSSRATAPPPTRGWTRRCPLWRHRRHGSPAHAGIDPVSASLRSCLEGLLLGLGSPAHAGMSSAFMGSSGIWRGLLRPRGDGLALAYVHPIAREAPPPTRGWTRDDVLLFLRDLGSPPARGWIFRQTGSAGRPSASPPRLGSILERMREPLREVGAFGGREADVSEHELGPRDNPARFEFKIGSAEICRF